LGFGTRGAIVAKALQAALVLRCADRRGM